LIHCCFGDLFDPTAMDAAFGEAACVLAGPAGGSKLGWPHHPADKLSKADDAWHVDDLPSTAASSVMHSPNAGPEGVPAHDKMELADLGPALAVLHPNVRVVAADGQPDLKQIKEQVERYFAAENLYHDMFLRSLMTPLGWVHLNDVVQFPELRQLGATLENAASALRDSWVVQLSGDSRRVRARVDAWRACCMAWAPLVPPLPLLGSLSGTSAGGGAARHLAFVPEVDVADEDLTIAATVEAPEQKPATPGAPGQLPQSKHRRRRAKPVSRTGAGAAAPPQSQQRWGDSPRRAARQGSAPLHLALDSDIAATSESPTSAAWLRVSDDAYPSAAASMLQW